MEMKMKQKQRFRGAALLFLVLFTLLGTAVLAQTSAGFNLEWHVIGNGGQGSISANYRVNGTIGQAVASQISAESANYKVSSGFWFGDSQTTIFLPAILKH